MASRRLAKETGCLLFCQSPACHRTPCELYYTYIITHSLGAGMYGACTALPHPITSDKHQENHYWYFFAFLAG